MTTQDQQTADPASGDTLARMARRHRAAAEARESAFHAALGQAFGRMAAQYDGLHARVTGVVRHTLSLAELLDLAEPGMFLSLLEGPQDRMGMVWLCPVAMAVGVDVQATGQVTPPDTGPAPRKPTRTDAALLSPMIDGFLRRAAERCAELPEAALVDGYVYGSFLDDPRPLGLMLEEASYEVMRLRVALGPDAIDAEWTLILPRPATPKAAAPPDAPADWGARMQAAVQASPVRLDAVLCSFTLSLRDTAALRRGDVLRIPESALEMLALDAVDGTRIAHGRLGQARGQRAVRLTAAPGTGRPAPGHGPPVISAPRIAPPAHDTQNPAAPPLAQDTATPPDPAPATDPPDAPPG